MVDVCVPHNHGMLQSGTNSVIFLKARFTIKCPLTQSQDKEEVLLKGLMYNQCCKLYELTAISVIPTD